MKLVIIDEFSRDSSDLWTDIFKVGRSIYDNS